MDTTEKMANILEDKGWTIKHREKALRINGDHESELRGTIMIDVEYENITQRCDELIEDLEDLGSEVEVVDVLELHEPGEINQSHILGINTHLKPVQRDAHIVIDHINEEFDEVMSPLHTPS